MLPAKISLISFLIFAIPGQVFSQNFPPKPSSLKLVNDFAKIYSYEESNLLEEKLIAYSNKTSTQIAIGTILDVQKWKRDSLPSNNNSNSVSKYDQQDK